MSGPGTLTRKHALLFLSPLFLFLSFLIRNPSSSLLLFFSYYYSSSFFILFFFPFFKQLIRDLNWCKFYTQSRRASRFCAQDKEAGTASPLQALDLILFTIGK